MTHDDKDSLNLFVFPLMRESLVKTCHHVSSVIHYENISPSIGESEGE